MKRNTILVVLSVIALNLTSLYTFSQEDPGRYQGMIVWEDVVYPSMIEAYEEATKMQIELYDEQDFPHYVFIYSTSEYIYYWGVPINSYADIDTLYQEFEEIYQKAPEKVEAINEAFEGTHESTKSWTCYWDRDLSYVPESGEGPALPGNFTFWSYNYIKKGKMDEMQEIFRAWVDLATEKKARQGWNTFIVDMGLETPCLYWVSYGADAADFYSTNAADMELMGEEAWELVKKQYNLTRKVEEQLGYYREDLSYSPEE